MAHRYPTLMRIHITTAEEMNNKINGVTHKDNYGQTEPPPVLRRHLISYRQAILVPISVHSDQSITHLNNITLQHRESQRPKKLGVFKT